MDKRYQVFISSTYTDLLEERQEVIQALLELDCIPAGMELFPAADDDQWTLIKKVIDDCDYYIIIVGGRYGSLSASGISYTEMEYNYAVSQGKPVIGFIHKDPGSIPASKTESSSEGKSKLEAFRGKVEQKMCKYWSSPSELGSVVSRSLVKLIKNNPAIGWVRANLIPDESSSQEILKLRKRIEELEEQQELTQARPPKGATELAQGDDLFQVRYSYFIQDNSGYPVSHDETCAITWSQLFSILSPILMGQASEKALKGKITEFVINRVSEYLDNAYPEEVEQISVESFDLDTIIIQFRALGLTMKGTLSSNTETYWTLTTYGEILMTRLRAVKKSTSPSDEDIPF